jgi:hypothetical protein
MKAGDLVRVAQRFTGVWGFDRKPIFNDGTAALGLVTELDRQGVNALVLIDGHREWVVLKNLEVVDEAQAG